MKLQNDGYGVALSAANLDRVSGGKPSLLGTLAKGAFRILGGPVVLVGQILLTPSKLGDGTLKGKTPPAPKK